jgi:hypothetical protein
MQNPVALENLNDSGFLFFVFLKNYSYYVSVVRSKENQGISLLKAWTTGKYEEQPKIIAKIYNNKVFYDDDAAKADMHAQNIIHDALEFPAPWRGRLF